MRILNATLILSATTLAAQEPPRAPRAPRPVAPPAAPAPMVAPAPRAYSYYYLEPATPIAPAPAMAPMEPLAPMMAPAPMTPMAPMAPIAPMAPVIAGDAYPIWHDAQGRPDRELAARIAEQAREMARRQAEIAREQSRITSEFARERAREQAEITREQSRIQSQVQRELAQQQSQMVREQAQQIREQESMFREQARMQAELFRVQPGQFGVQPGQFALAVPTPRPFAYSGQTLPEMPPRAWAQGDPADSMYKAAYDVMNKGDYRRAAVLFKEIPVKYKYSQYAVEAMYWQAHALYRVGNTQDLQEALQVLETLKATYPNTRIRNSNADVGALSVRIAGVLSARGMGGNEIVRRAIAQNTSVCDREEVQIRTAALNALMQTDEAAALEYAGKVLTKKDECSRELRRNAVFVIGNKGGATAPRTLIDVARNDPSQEVRSSAIQYLGRSQSDEALTALEELMKSSTEVQVQRDAIRALAGNPSPRARAGIKALVERNDVSESLRRTALDALDPERSTQEDVNWLQNLYTKVESSTLRSRIINAMGRMGGTQNERWFMTLVNNENESIDVRVEAIRRVGQNMDIAALGKLYDQTGQRSLRNELVRQLANRREPEAVDKLGDIAKNGTDVDVRMRAIDALRNKKDDPRASKLLLALIDRP